MGTLFEQPVRNRRPVDYNHFISYVKELARIHGVEFRDAVEVLKLAEMQRRNDLFVDNGDIHDEQMAGFGALFSARLED